MGGMMRSSSIFALPILLAGLLAVTAVDPAGAKDKTVTGPTFGPCSLGGSKWDCEGGIVCSCCEGGKWSPCWMCDAEDGRPLGGTCEQINRAGNRGRGISVPGGTVLDPAPSAPQSKGRLPINRGGSAAQ